MKINEKQDLCLYLKMDNDIKVNGLKIKEMVEELIFGLMGKDMMDFGKMESLMALVDANFLTEMFMKEISFKTKNTVLVSNNGLVVKFIKESG